MLQKVLKFANYVVAVLVSKLCFFAPIMPKIMFAQSAKAYQWSECHAVSTNHIIGTNGRVECTPTQPEAIGNIRSPYNEMHKSKTSWLNSRGKRPNLAKCSG